MPINSKQKGAAGEREWAEFCRQNGFSEARRGQQYNGLEGEDVVGLPYIHQEVKRVERLNIYEAMEQSEKDTAHDKYPIVAHRKNRKYWMVTMDAMDWFELYKGWLKNYEKENSEPLKGA